MSELNTGSGKGSTQKNIVPVLPFIGCISAPGMEATRVRDIVEEEFAATGLKSEIFSFTATDYYRDEMGHGLSRRFFAFPALADPARMPGLKDAASRLEARHSEKGRRILNMDPGYIDLFKVVLISGKYGGMKIQISGGYFADIVLVYEEGGFYAPPRTFPDFGDGTYHSYFTELRNIYRILRNSG